LNVATPSILIIDDEPGICEIVRETALRFCPNVYEANTGSDGLKLVRSHSPTVVVSDYNMPGLNGLELLKFMRDERCFAPVIWMTGRGTPELFREAWRVGVYEIFEKPFRMEDLRRCLEGVLGLVANPTNANAAEPLTSPVAAGSNQIYYKDISIHLDKKLHQRLVDECLRQGVSVTTYLTRVIETQLGPADAKKDAA
jgi:two-component system response regulator (stage 0 sporulation protein F)